MQVHRFSMKLASIVLVRRMPKSYRGIFFICPETFRDLAALLFKRPGITPGTGPAFFAMFSGPTLRSVRAQVRRPVRGPLNVLIRLHAPRAQASGACPSA